ncbi:hypothetical protein [Paenibacillus hubeiensis]|uniref:hypothetical protein n=1 Tax=Paenibacillus hubeiensis TaxID=3077330 RepID=UPI0031BAD148
MDNLTKGTWLVNSANHLVQVKSTAAELSYFEATAQAGKAGNFLSRLIADKQEIISFEKAKVFARQSGISAVEIKAHLDALKLVEKIDYNIDSLGKIHELEIYCFSAVDALNTVANIYDSFEPGRHEEASLLGLQATYERPRYQDEVAEMLTTQGVDEEAATTTLQLQAALGLVKTSDVESEKLFYNEYAFSGDVSKVAKAIRGLEREKRQMVEEVQNLVMDTPGFLSSAIPEHIDPTIIKLMEGVGLLDGITVRSVFGEATYFTAPQSKGQGIGNTFPVSADVFHKAKVLLSCLRFGQTESVSGRGRISTQQKMMRIVNKLCRGEWVGKCTAIGQDYQLLEMDGVIETSPAGGGQFYMKLRQMEVGTMVQQLLNHNKLLPESEVNVEEFMRKQPNSYITPEVRRKQIEAQDTASVANARALLLNTVRTGLSE